LKYCKFNETISCLHVSIKYDAIMTS